MCTSLQKDVIGMERRESSGEKSYFAVQVERVSPCLAYFSQAVCHIEKYVVSSASYFLIRTT